MGAVLAAVTAWLLERRWRSYVDLATTPAAAVSAGRNEVSGRAWAAAPLTSRLTGTAAVRWDYRLEEERRHTRTVTSQGSNGQTTTRTETYEQWHVIEEDGGSLAELDVV